ncbi:PIN domain-containing protein [Candidatus Neomicrothrix sp.]|mgnify:CR=1 FL=1|uniref:PIN domain-containing protein n=1 Tax=Candidatus Neomicrothrix sp. TaxID=2719034 RepID=UPI0025936F43|nr:PIN domain-containing protein [Candidatus Microthrix sp.]HMS46113.1 PIN domain-containing protein [Candidatus Microthrix sp.]
MEVAVDTSVAVPLIMQAHTSHRQVRGALVGRSLVLTGHSLAETYSVLTRLPGDARLAAHDAATVIAATFGAPALLAPESAATMHTTLAKLGIAGGAVYDGLVALAALDNGLGLISRDNRAAATYATLGVEVEMIR